MVMILSTGKTSSQKRRDIHMWYLWNCWVIEIDKHSHQTSLSDKCFDIAMKMINCYASVLLVFISIIGYASSAEFPTVKIQQGLLQGTYGRSYDGRVYSAFEGIPYAQPPIGKLRFAEPVPAPRWSGTLIANKHYKCTQIDGTQSVVGTEDCLYIYVYVPRDRISKQDNFDVVVHLHGGSLVFGSPYDMVLPDYLMDKDVIVVSLNYRLGAAGFLSTGNCIVPGNNGLKDQVLALKWIKNNIKDFGGNPDSVTITGFSSGSMSVHFHYLSPRSRGLFTRGYSSSSVVTNSAGLTLMPLRKAELLAQNVSCPTSNVERMVSCLRGVPIGKIVDATLKTELWFKPAVERKIPGGPDPFLPDIPYKLLKNKNILNAPWVASNVINESLFSLESVYRNRSEIFSIYNNWNAWSQRWLDLVDYVDEDKQEATFDALKRFYLDDSKVTEDNGLEKLNRLMTHRHFLVGTDLALRTHAASTRAPVYFYLFKFVPEDRLEFFGPPAASHGVDSKLLFKFRTNPDRLKPEGEKMMRLFTEFMAEYAKTGIPKIGNIIWTPINSNECTLNVLEINSPDEIKMTTVKELVPRRLWDSLPIKENNHLC